MGAHLPRADLLGTREAAVVSKSRVMLDAAYGLRQSPWGHVHLNEQMDCHMTAGEIGRAPSLRRGPGR